VGRFLFVVPPLEGHVNPTISVAEELTVRGHTVAWVAHPRIVRPLLPLGATLIPLDDRLPDDLIADRAQRAQVRGLERFKFLYEDFLLPLARLMIPGIEAAADEFHPDVIISDQQALAGALVARRSGHRWATSVTTSAALMELMPLFPKVSEWRAEKIAELQREAAVPVVEQPEISPHLVMVFSSKEMVGLNEFPPQFHFVGPSFGSRPVGASFPWEWLDEMPRILVTLGTVNAPEGRRFFDAVIEGLADTPIQVIIVAPDSLLGDALPKNVLVRPRVPQLELLRHINAVICHAGHNTVCEALANALPLIVAPIKDDQSTIAEQIVQTGAGIRLKFGRLSAAQLRTAVEKVLHDSSYKLASARIQKSFEAAGGAARAAALLEELLVTARMGG
jgi:MGT family glycosyltransferase